LTEEVQSIVCPFSLLYAEVSGNLGAHLASDPKNDTFNTLHLLLFNDDLLLISMKCLMICIRKSGENGLLLKADVKGDSLLF
jgi:hypothetical protein